MGEGTGPGVARLSSAGGQVAPFLVAGILAPLITVGGGTSTDWSMVAASLALLVVTMLGLTWAVATAAPEWAHMTWVVGWLLALTMLVHGTGGAGAGATLVLLLPALWMSLYGSRLEALVVLALMLTGVGVVTLFDGATELDTVDIRRIVVFLTVPALAVWTVSTLVQRLARSERDSTTANATLTIVARAAQQIRQSSDPRLAACEAMLAVTGATAVLILEPEGSSQLRATASIGRDFAEFQLPLKARSLTATSYQEGRMIFVPETHADARVDPRIVSATGARSILVQPFGHNGVVHGVLELTWADPYDEPPGQSAIAVTLLAQEIGWSIERADLMNSLQRRATTDTLTGLGNRRVWREEMQRLTTSQLCVAIADLDHFKVYNDTHGHAAGDRLLRDLAESWQGLVRPDDLLVRWGGEEFAIALPGCSLQRAAEVLERLRLGVPLGESASFGVAERRPGEPIEVLMARADAALYAAKHGGRNRIKRAVTEPVNA